MELEISHSFHYMLVMFCLPAQSVQENAERYS